MKTLILLIILLFSVNLKNVDSFPNPTSHYFNKVILVEPNIFTLYWNRTANDIIFEIHVATTGWAAFGLSPNGGMDGSDVIVSWINNDGSYHFTDRHIKDRKVEIDEIQNWFLLYSAQKDDYLITKFTRKIKLCDEKNQDLDIEEGTPHVIFSWNNQLINEEIMYHGYFNRGTYSVPFLSSLNDEIELNMEETETLDLIVNTTIPDRDTEYYCEMFSLPEEWMNKKRHVLRFETVHHEGNERNIHHWAVYECTKSFETEYLSNNNYTLPAAGSCYSNIPYATSHWAEIYAHCNKLSFAWAVGGNIIQDFPRNLAYPMGKDRSESKYLFIEMHYNNPKLKIAKDMSGIRLYATQNYRPEEFGIIYTGAVENWTAQIIPPKAKDFRMDYHCRSSCFTNLFDTSEEIKVFSAMPHAHLFGKEVITTVVRDGKDVEYITNNKKYDFNHQYYNFLSKPVTLKKGDSIKTTCAYNTMRHKQFILGGLSTRDEMCLNFIWYYPRNSGMNNCQEYIGYEHWNVFLKDFNISREINFAKYPKNIEDILEIFPGENAPDLVEKFQNFFENAKRVGICRNQQGYFNTKNEPIHIEPMQKKCIKSN